MPPSALAAPVHDFYPLPIALCARRSPLQASPSLLGIVVWRQLGERHKPGAFPAQLIIRWFRKSTQGERRSPKLCESARVPIYESESITDASPFPRLLADVFAATAVRSAKRAQLSEFLQSLQTKGTGRIRRSGMVQFALFG